MDFPSISLPSFCKFYDIEDEANGEKEMLPPEFEEIYQDALDQNQKELSECKSFIATAKRVDCLSSCGAYACPGCMLCAGATAGAAGISSIVTGGVLGIKALAFTGLGVSVFVAGGFCVWGTFFCAICCEEGQRSLKDPEVIKAKEELKEQKQLKKFLTIQKKLLENEEFKKFILNHNYKKLPKLLSSQEFKQFANDFQKEQIDSEKFEEKLGSSFEGKKNKKPYRYNKLEK